MKFWKILGTWSDKMDMETTREMLKKPVVIAVIAGIIGLALGLLFAWVVWPTQFVDADPSYLRSDFMEDYLRMAIDSNTLRPDPLVAKRRYDILGEKGADSLAVIQANPNDNDPAAIAAFATAINAPAGVVPTTAPGAEGTETGSGEVGAPLPDEEENQSGSGSSLLTLLLIFCGLTIVLGLAALIAP